MDRTNKMRRIGSFSTGNAYVYHYREITLEEAKKKRQAEETDRMIRMPMCFPQVCDSPWLDGISQGET